MQRAAPLTRDDTDDTNEANGDEQSQGAKAKGSVALGPLPNLFGSVPEAQPEAMHIGGRRALSGQSAGETLDTLYQSSGWNNKIAPVPLLIGCSAKVPEI